MLFNNTKTTVITAAVVIAVIAVCAVLLTVSGDIEYTFEDNSFTVHSGMWKDLTVNYADIEAAELRQDIESGKRNNGFGSRKLSLGTFSNEEFGSYTLYRWNECGTLVLLTMKDGSVIVLGGENEAASRSILKELSGRTS